MDMTRLTKAQVKNLHKLGNYLASLPSDYEHFDITSFASCVSEAYNLYGILTPHTVPAKINNCGSSACGIGHGPVIGLRSKHNESWWSYGERVFGVIADANADLDYDGVSLWVDVFSADWIDEHNHHHALVERLDRWLSKHSYPARPIITT